MTWNQRGDVFLEPDFLACGDEVFPAHAAKLRVVPQQVREFRPLLNQLRARQSFHLFLEARDAEHLAQRHA